MNANSPKIPSTLPSQPPANAQAGAPPIAPPVAPALSPKENARNNDSHGNLYGDLERLISSVSEDMPFHERSEWMFRAVQWLRTNHSHFAHPQYLFELLDRHPRAKARCARAMRSLLRELAAVDFLYDVNSRQRPASEVYENDIMHLMQVIFASEADLIWFSHLDSESVKSLIALFNYEIGPTERKWNRLNEDVRQSLVLLGSRMRLTAREWSKLQRQDRNEVFDQTAYARIGLLIDHLIVAKSERPANESALIAQELYLLIRQCRRLMDEARQRLLTTASSSVEVEHAELLFRQLTRLKTLINIYTHRNSFQRDSIKLLLPLMESFLESGPNVGVRARTSYLLRAAEQKSEKAQAHVRFRHWSKATGSAAIMSGVGIAIIAGLYTLAETSPTLPTSAKWALQFFSFALGFTLLARFNLKFFSELLPWELSQITKDLRQVSGRHTSGDEWAAQIAGQVKTQVVRFAMNLAGLAPSIFWVSLMVYVFSHHALMDKDEAVKVGMSFSKVGTMALGGFLSGLAWFVSVLFGNSLLAGKRKSGGFSKVQKVVQLIRAQSFYFLPAAAFAFLFMVGNFLLNQISLDLNMHLGLVDSAKFLLALGAAGNTLAGAKLVAVSILGLALVCAGNFTGSFGVAFFISWLGQTKRPKINFQLLAKLLVNLKPAGGIVPTRAGMDVPEISETSAPKAPAWMAGGGQVKTRGTSFSVGGVENPPGSPTSSAVPVAPTANLAPVPVFAGNESGGNEKTEVMTRHPLRTNAAVPLQTKPILPGPVEIELSVEVESDHHEKTEVMVRPVQKSNEKTEVVIPFREARSAAFSSPNEKTEVITKSMTKSMGLGEYGEKPEEKTEVMTKSAPPIKKNG